MNKNFLRIFGVLLLLITGLLCSGCNVIPTPAPVSAEEIPAETQTSDAEKYAPTEIPTTEPTKTPEPSPSVTPTMTPEPTLTLTPIPTDTPESIPTLTPSDTPVPVARIVEIPQPSENYCSLIDLASFALMFGPGITVEHNGNTWKFTENVSKHPNGDVIIRENPELDTVSVSRVSSGKTFAIKTQAGHVIMFNFSGGIAGTTSRRQLIFAAKLREKEGGFLYPKFPTPCVGDDTQTRSDLFSLVQVGRDGMVQQSWIKLCEELQKSGKAYCLPNGKCYEWENGCPILEIWEVTP